jgi:hypothetical protein
MILSTTRAQRKCVYINMTQRNRNLLQTAETLARQGKKNFKHVDILLKS